jgi:hypothetical protein
MSVSLPTGFPVCHPPPPPPLGDPSAKFKIFYLLKNSFTSHYSLSAEPHNKETIATAEIKPIFYAELQKIKN